MKTVIIIQARMTSTRLPGKILLTVLGKPLLGYQIERLRRVRQADDIIIATPTDVINQPLWDFASQEGIALSKGDENDVLARYYGAASAAGADIVVRITSDCPLIDPRVVDNVIQYYKSHPDPLDYVSNTLKRTYPRGLDTEVFSFAALRAAFYNATTPWEREHVTPYLYDHPDRFRLANVAYTRDESQHRWTVDTPEDFQLIKTLLESLYPTHPMFTLEDCLDFMQAHPETARINADIQQKAVHS